MSVLDYHAKEAPADLYKQDRIGVLFFLLLHVNNRNRCWPSYDTIQEHTGIHRASIVRAIAWLRSCGAIELVPFAKRVGREIDLPVRQHVYQLTGDLHWDDKTIPYLHFMRDADPESSNGRTFKSSVDPESSNVEPKVLTESCIDNLDPKKINTSKTNISAAGKPAPKISKFTHSDEVKNAFSIVCYNNVDAWKINAAIMVKALNQIAMAENHPVEIEDLRQFRQWWKKSDWRGKQQQLPEPYTVVSVWARFRAGEDSTEQLTPEPPKPPAEITRGKKRG